MTTYPKFRTPQSRLRESHVHDSTQDGTPNSADKISSCHFLTVEWYSKLVADHSLSSVELEAPWELWMPPSVDSIRENSLRRKWNGEILIHHTEERCSHFLSSLLILWKTSSLWNMNENLSLDITEHPRITPTHLLWSSHMALQAKQHSLDELSLKSQPHFTASPHSSNWTIPRQHSSLCSPLLKNHHC